MLHKVLEINSDDRYICLDRGFVCIKSGEEVVGKVPIDDVGVLLLSSQQITLSKNVLNALCENGCITILCGKNYAPESMVMPVAGHYMMTKILTDQIEATEPFKKRIWQQIVIAKITNQAKSLVINGFEEDSRLIFKIAGMVKSGDSENREAYAARMYWKSLFGGDFIRDKDGEGINSFLNYGYAVLRSSMARAICSAGLLPSLGVHHDNKTNQFCLVDDLMEVYRPIVDCVVFNLYREGETELTPQNKKTLAKCLDVKVKTTQGDSPVHQSMHYMAQSLVYALETKKSEIQIPVWEEGTDEGPSDERI